MVPTRCDEFITATLQDVQQLISQLNTRIFETPTAILGKEAAMKALRSALLAKGTVLSVKLPGAAFLPAIRLRQSCWDVPTTVDMERALRMHESGSDAQSIANVVGHQDPSTVAAFLRAWVDAEKGLKVPPNLLDADPEELSDDARIRAKTRPGDLFGYAFVVEACGARRERNGDLTPILPINWMGREFCDGAALDQALQELGEEYPRELRKLLKYENLARSHNIWETKEDLARTIEARGLTPSVIVKVRHTYPHTTILPFTEAHFQDLDSSTHVFQVLSGRDGNLSGDKKEDHSIVIAVTEQLLQDGTSNILNEEPILVEERSEAEVDANANLKVEGVLTSSKSTVSKSIGENFLPPPSQTMLEVDLPLSLLHKSILRGASFSTPRQINFAVQQLLQTQSIGQLGASATHLLLWRLFAIAWRDVCPYFPPARRKAIFSLPDLLGLSLVSYIDSSFRLTEVLSDRVQKTALALQAHEDVRTVLWPWRGFMQQVREKTLVIEDDEDACVQLRNALRCASMGPFPVANAADRDMFRRYLTCLQEPTWAEKVKEIPQPKVTQSMLGMVHPASVAEMETMKASMDARFSANLLLFLQAAMPSPPKNTLQHSIRSLGMLVDRISGYLNVRSVRKQLAGQEDDAELFRIQQFLGANSDKMPESKNLDDAAKDMVILQETVTETLKLTPHENLLSGILQDVQNALWLNTMQHAPASWRDGPYGVTSGLDEDQHIESIHSITDGSLQRAKATSSPHGRSPTPLEARTAFLQLFGRQFVLSPTKASPTALSVILAGDAKEPLLVKLVETKSSGMQNPNRFLDTNNPLVAEARKRLSALGPQHVKVNFPPPQGFRWIWDDPTKSHHPVNTNVVTEVKLGGYNADQYPPDPPARRKTRRMAKQEILEQDARTHHSEQIELLEFWVNNQQIPVFDASSLLVPCNAPLDEQELYGELRQLVEEAFYISSECSTTPSASLKIKKAKAGKTPTTSYMDLFRRLEDAARCGRHGNVDAVYNWSSILEATPITPHVFRDLLLKIMMMEGNSFSLSASAGVNSQHWQQDFTNEGTALRVMFGLAALYPGCIERVKEHQFQTFTRFRILSKSNLQYVDFIESLRKLAFPVEEEDADGMKQQLASQIEVTTKLWSHQQETVDKVTEGIQGGMLGFADASTVGAGKTLSALACIASAQKIISSRGETLRGSLVLLPTNSLISEWTTQIMLHTKDVHVLAQDKSGFLKTLGISNAGEPARRIARGRHIKVDADSIVLTTLGRARDHPFSTLGWDLVIIDEAVSVQSQTALQSFAAWRQVLASRCGVMMLSATMYRSRMSDLFVLIRMLRSPLPRIQPYLATLLSEHAIVALPENPRKWHMEFRPVYLDDDAKQRYRALVEQSFHGHGVSDARSLYEDLKTFLRHNYEQTLAVNAIASEVETFRKSKRRPLVFAANENEKKLLLKAIPNSETLPGSGDAKNVLIVTVREGSHGLNLQEYADAVVTRPQPGDIMEQMKGRIDRPGQKVKNLLLTVVVAHDTIEEAEAANIRICGSFFRQYLDPLSRTFQERAMSSMESIFDTERTTAKTKKGPSKPQAPAQRYKTRYGGALANDFRSHLETFIDNEEYLSSASNSITGGTSTDISLKPPSTTRRTTARKRKHDVLEEENEVATSSDEDKQDANYMPASNLKTAEEIPPAKRRKSVSQGETASKRKTLAEKNEAKSVVKGPLKPKRKKRPSETEFLGQGPPQKISDELMAQALAHFAKNDPKMANVVNQVGAPTKLMEKVGVADPFMALTRSIIYQQISTKAGASIFKRFDALLENDITPTRIMKTSIEDLRSAGLSARKAEYVKSLSEHFQTQDLSRKRLDSMSDDEVFNSLIKVKGIGPWSIHMFLLFSLGRPDVLPYGDLVVRKGFKRLYNLSNGEEVEDTKVVRLPDEYELLELSTAWRPYRSIGTWLMWHAVESESAAYTF